jgi:hypothetical protein
VIQIAVDQTVKILSVESSDGVALKEREMAVHHPRLGARGGVLRERQ